MAKKGSAVLKAITTRAKQMRKKHPGMAWLSAVKKAGAEYRGKKKPASRKKPSVKRRKKISGIRQNVDRVDRKKVNVTIGSVSHHISTAKRLLSEKIGRLEGDKFRSEDKKFKRIVSKRIAECKRIYRQLK